ncbi:Sec63-domain-containing protein [Sistotremastrum niveocremeum HHB9708]|uniref:Sec63-domain-containing protein n=1 Tax=Sistotremastrum niveocremeum HHB9708 TaxID=1314777 RepID=A0A164ZP77_9AGAM|nr:Sec63-domain-containing protein [Sistotremastrum niveocremeum HHB9708]
MSNLRDVVQASLNCQTSPSIRDSVQEWSQRLLPSSDASVAAHDATLSEVLLESHLRTSRFGSGFASNASPVDNLIANITEDPQVRPLIPSILDALSAGHSDDRLSGELSELLGFDKIELVMEILSQKDAFLGALNQRHMRTANGDVSSVSARERMEAQFRNNALKPLFRAKASEDPEELPHVYTSQVTSFGRPGEKFLLPLGTTREDFEDCEEVTIPPARTVPPRGVERLIPIHELDPLARGAFKSYSTLNRIQSIVYHCAYQTNENMLVCGPTGAGKTDVAMLAILHTISSHMSRHAMGDNIAPSSIDRKAFKIIYVAPMKALASEITRKLGKRLAWLSIKVRELTGDMQMTKAEIAETQVIITTPEKWDVVTRKPTGEGEVAATVKLLIIDEVHLLNEDRGAVIETIVARTLRQVESTQSMIRIVGLSATLPNFVDVADFLRVSRQSGLFFFDSSFRPVPLEQHFLGIRGKANSPAYKKNLDAVTFRKVAALVEAGHQVMVFVHARKETVKAAEALREAAIAEGNIDEFSCQEHPQWTFFHRDIANSRNKEMKQLFDVGFGIHHAGMLRSDRNLMERLFEARAIKVLCCTATLAWGVNLPAHAVIIKGTQVYDSGRGTFVDLSVLDVLQIFGRAGRPGLETSGEGYICTNDDKLNHYLDAVTSQHPIESSFVKGMVDALNAEIALGTVTNVSEAVRWLGYTYLFVRMRRNPFFYGMDHDETSRDPELSSKRNHLVLLAARKLVGARMILFNESTESFSITDLGRIAARYYIRHSSVEVFNEMFKKVMTEADILAMLSASTEFDQIQVRESEIPELKVMMDEVIPCQVKGGTDTSQGKVNILLQGFISQTYVEDFALVSDMNYAAQNGGRIIRAILDIAMSRKWACVAAVSMALSKAIEKRMWPFDHPLKQFKLSPDTMYNLERWADEYSPAELATMSASDLGALIHLNERHGTAILRCARQFPTAKITHKLRPLNAELLQVHVSVTRSFEWDNQVHGFSEPFIIWIEDEDGLELLQYAHLLFSANTDRQETDFLVSIPANIPPPKLRLRFISDRWIGAEEEVEIDLDDLRMPVLNSNRTALLDLPFLPTSAVPGTHLQRSVTHRFGSFNAMQTQVFWSVINTSQNVLLCSSAGSGKSLLGYVSVIATASQLKGGVVLWLTPNRSFAKEAVRNLKALARSTSLAVELILDPSHIPSTPKGVWVVTPNVLNDLFLSASPIFSEIKSVVLDALHLLDSEYELAISSLLQSTQTSRPRIIGLSSCLHDPSDLAEWLDVQPQFTYSFHSRDREQSVMTTSETFTIPHSAALFRAMVKPMYSAIRSSPADSGTVVFVPSRKQCSSVASDLIKHCAVEGNVHGFLGPEAEPENLQGYLYRLRNPSLMEPLLHGIGVYHHEVNRDDQELILRLFVEGVVRVLIAPRDACWTIPVRANVIVMGTQYISVTPGSSNVQLKDYDIRELVQMQGRAAVHGAVGHFHVLCQSETRSTIMRFLEEGLPLESHLLEDPVLARWIARARASGLIQSPQDIMDVLSWSFLRHRISSNGLYYDAKTQSPEETLSRLADTLFTPSQVEQT